MAVCARYWAGVVATGLACAASAQVPCGGDEAGHRNVLVSVQICLGDPLPNLVLMYSCDVFGAAAAAAFGIDENSVDKASLAFDQKAYLYLVPGNTEPCRTGTSQGRAGGQRQRLDIRPVWGRVGSQIPSSGRSGQSRGP